MKGEEIELARSNGTWIEAVVHENVSHLREKPGVLGIYFAACPYCQISSTAKVLEELLPFVTLWTICREAIGTGGLGAEKCCLTEHKIKHVPSMKAMNERNFAKEIARIFDSRAPQSPVKPLQDLTLLKRLPLTVEDRFSKPATLRTAKQLCGTREKFGSMGHIERPQIKVSDSTKLVEVLQTGNADLFSSMLKHPDRLGRRSLRVLCLTPKSPKKFLISFGSIKSRTSREAWCIAEAFCPFQP